MAERCAVIGVGQTHHKAKRDDVSIAGLVREAAKMALADADLTWSDIDAVVINPSGGPLAANPLMSAGLIRIGEAASRIRAGQADRAVAHATSGPCLQQNLVCVLEGE